jgi:hypothetical protein
LSGSGIRTKRLEHRAADVLLDDRGAHVGDLAALGQPVDDARVERVGVGHRDVQQEVVAAGDDEHADGLGQGAGPVALAIVRCEASVGDELVAGSAVAVVSEPPF